ncbi:MAG: ABC transporter substrate-binding protein [Erythrobacter sp.]
MFGKALAAILLGIAAVAAAPAAARHNRIVSINPCVDAVLVEVAEPQQILAISHYSQDARASSIPLPLARRFRATSGTAEEIVALRPDLVLAGAHVSPSTIAALGRLGIPVQTFGVPANVAEATAQVRAIAQAAGQQGRGAALITRIDEAVAAAQQQAALAGSPVPALIWQASGLVPGQNTLADELLRIAGFRNMSAEYGLKRWDVLPLEHLSARPPRVLLTDRIQGDRMTNHRVLANLAGRMTRAQFDERLLSCAGPVMIRALGRLAQVRASL